MPRWKALPEELDPQSREFVARLRQLVDRSGLSLAAVADRTGYSRTSWERYLNGGLLAPRGAIIALAEVTGAEPHRLTAMWETAERAWSRSETRHHMTMEAIRASRARTAPGGGRTGGRRGVSSTGGAVGDGAGPGLSPSVPARRGTVPRIRQPQPPHPAPDPGTAGSRRGAGPGRPRGGGRRRIALFLAGVLGALLLMAGAVLFIGLGGDDDAGAVTAAPSAEPGPGAARPPAGVECGGAGCAGQDPETMGCGGRFADTVARATVGGTLVEVRWSETCGAAWARLTRASAGDTVRITAGSSEQEGAVGAEADAYTPMVAADEASDARACATLASGATGCTTPD
ncbi:helix-turn-helix domain-containing protein [[Kitasatospora] papulosa]|uniref:helix-turn-helix domain-containing protein n=1 Tax=[Kitasatospora] papulosa TaxID=1464011 RepID=UPI00380BBF74